MKKIAYTLTLLILLATACKNSKETEVVNNENKSEMADLMSFGEQIDKDNTLTAEEMLGKFKNLKVGDTIQVKFASKINEVCSKKGCWMKLPLDNSTETMVRFKDYGFFMPLNSKDKEVIVEGKAFVKQTSVDELRHYAEDAGKSKEEIAKITEPKTEFSFEAHGVLMKK
ncbi:MAG: DUF4920 domain-containing protein [Flavobacteriaceae bacterium]|nr:DUF4920 domain-containing protein [Flavobacteriaceae bacterium]